jgi:F-type H+-transporting ATPase subunit b
MEATLHALSGILLRAIPTFLLVFFLHFYLKYIFFKPLGKVLHARYEATEGARLRAAESLERAAAKTAEYEAALRAARSEVYQTQEQLHRRLQEEQAAQVHAAREQTEAAVRDAKAQLASEIARAKTDLAAESGALAGQIADALLNRGLVA